MQEILSISKIISCRVCRDRRLLFVHDFGIVPLADKLTVSITEAVPFAPLSLSYCPNCCHLQINENISPNLLFTEDYPYFSGKIPEVAEHFAGYAESVKRRYAIKEGDLILEIASNDGTLLQHFHSLTRYLIGVEPSKGPAKVSANRGIETIVDFWDESLAAKLFTNNKPPRLILANNVLAHVPDPVSFVKGIARISDKQTICIFEVPHALHILINNTFDVIFHQHFSYFTAHSLKYLLENNGLFIQEVETVNTQGGSLRIHSAKQNPKHRVQSLDKVLEEEYNFGVCSFDIYARFSSNIFELKTKLRSCLINFQKEGAIVAGYGAPGKAATLLNYFNIHYPLLKYLVDVSPTKQGKYFPETGLYIYPLEQLSIQKPDYILILAWNYTDSILSALSFLREQGTKFILMYPTFRII